MRIGKGGVSIRFFKTISKDTYDNYIKHWKGTKIIKQDKLLFVPQNKVYIKNELKERFANFVASLFVPIISLLNLLYLIIQSLPRIYKVKRAIN